MTFRILVAGLLGAIAMFIWTGIAHMATPLGYIGFSQLSNEAPALAALQGSAGEKNGLYIFPWTDPKSATAMKDYEAKTKAGPSGLLLYRAPGHGESMSGATLLHEFLKQLIVCLIAAFLLTRTALTSYIWRAGFVATIGVIASLETNASYWIWYGFPLSYTLAQIFIALVSYKVAGLAIAAWLRPAKS